MGSLICPAVAMISTIFSALPYFLNPCFDVNRIYLPPGPNLFPADERSSLLPPAGAEGAESLTPPRLFFLLL